MSRKKSIIISLACIITIILFVIVVVSSFANSNLECNSTKENSREDTTTIIHTTIPQQKTLKRNNNKVKQYNQLEIPLTTSKDFIIKHTGYTLSYDKNMNNPKWVAWELTKEELTQVIPRTNNFRGDEQIEPRHRVETRDYNGSHYDRGHMCPSADMRWSKDAQNDCFYMSNICPQVSELNQVWWEHLETAERRGAKQEGAVYICCGPIYKNERKNKSIGNNIKIRVPNGFFKVILSLRKNHEKGIGFIYSNRDSHQPMEEVACSIDQVEEVTGINFYHKLPQELEKKLEASYNLSEWR